MHSPSVLPLYRSSVPNFRLSSCVCVWLRGTAQEVDFLQVTDGNPSNIVPYMHQLDRVLSENAGLIERLKASLVTFKGSRARHQVAT